jgi:formate dehydrogenase major subunit
MRHKVDHQHRVKSHYHFVKAVNHYILSNDYQNEAFIQEQTSHFEDYKKHLLEEDFQVLIDRSGLERDQLIAFAENYLREPNAIIIFSEKNVSPATGAEIFNLAMMTGKIGKKASGIISLKEKNNSQGIFDMGISSWTGTGNQSLNDKEFVERLKSLWNTTQLPDIPDKEHIDLLDKGKIKKMYIFGEDPVGCAIDKERVNRWFSKTRFVLVQDYFMTETAAQADLILPATMPVESSGTFTNTQRYIQQFDKQLESKVERENYRQLLDLLKSFDQNGFNSVEAVRKEALSLLPSNQAPEYIFELTDEPGEEFRLFRHGCDSVMKYFDNRFEAAFQ